MGRCLAALFLVQLALILISGGTYGGADNISHFRIARYAFEYPHLLLDHWGKPVFTALMAPFALGGFKCAKVFNLLAGLACIIVSVKLLKCLAPKHPSVSLALPVFIAFSPPYFLLMQSCMTEVLFSLFLVLSVYLFVQERYGASAVLLSFLPFVRTEGVVVFPFFILAFFFKKKYREILLTGAGTLFYSLTGYFHTGDLLWVVHQMPYSLGESLYGSGSLLHFPMKSPEIFGWPFLVFLVAGLVVWTVEVLKNLGMKKESTIRYLLIVGPWTAYFAFHGFLWWKGIGGSLGLIRVIAGVVPLAAITASRGLDAVPALIRKPGIQSLLVLAVILLQVAAPFTRYEIPVPPSRTEILMKEAAVYVAENQRGGKIHYFDPFLVHFLNMDPFDPGLTKWGVDAPAEPSRSMSPGDILVWDAHFGANEGRVSLGALKRDPFLEPVKTFLPAEPFQVLGGYDYGIRIFRKREGPIL